MLLAMAGCDASGGRVNPPVVVPTEMARAALSQYDANGDQALGGEELDRCPGLKSSLSISDTNHDGRLTADEIAGRLQSFMTARIGLVGVNVKVSLDGRPLDGARLVLTPEKFLGSALKQATCVSGRDGLCWFRVSDDLPGVQPGIYRIEVYKTSVDGKETIPPRYNSESIFGIDAGADSPALLNPPHLALSSK